jgi:uncharacterized membrane protein
MKIIKEYSIVFAIGGVIYSLIEILSRGFTHWTMTITGGAAFLTLYMINIKMKAKKLITKCFIGSLAITAIEFIVGIIVNRQLNMGVWDYSNQRLNIMGQVCPLFSIIWFLLCIPGFILCFAIKKVFTSGKRKWLR